MSRRPTLSEIRREVLLELDDEWRTPTELQRELGIVNNQDFYKVALVIERLANDGLAELERPGSIIRRFRRAA